MTIGNVALVFNAHFPYVRRAGRWPHGEESLHKVMAESYVPLLVMLSDLRDIAPTGLPLTLAPSPILLEQLADPVISEQFVLWMHDWRERAVADLHRFERAGDGHGVYLARFYLDWIDSIEQAFTGRFGRQLAGVVRGLLRESTDLLLSPATYAYLPHLDPIEARAQIDTGALSVLRQLGRRPGGLWLPGGGVPHGLHSLARELGLRLAVGMPLDRSARSAGDLPFPVVHPERGLIEHVIAPGIGYPGDGLYREFHRDHPESGIAYWRVTGAHVPLHEKAPYDPYLAFSRVDEHATHFVRAIRSSLRHATAHDQPTVVLAFDAELFGHWWFEGVRWLEQVLRLLIADDDLRLVTLSQIVNDLPLHEMLPSAPHPVFDAPLIAPLRRRAMQAAHQLRAAVRSHPATEGCEEALLTQAARELLLARSSDWLVLIAAGTAEDYARRRFDEHLARMERLLRDVERDDPSPDAEAFLHEIAGLDNPFPFLNYRLFG